LYIFKPKIPIWESFGEPWNGKCWYILWPFGVYKNHIVGISNGHLAI
jgi:hypothetical protein